SSNPPLSTLNEQTAGKRNEQRAEVLFPKCETGDIKACAELARIYPTLNSALRDRSARILELLRNKCSSGALDSCRVLGSFYQAAGVGHPRDTLALFERACAGGDAAGCNLAGYAYATGQGTARNLARALELYQKSCAGKDPDGC